MSNSPVLFGSSFGFGHSFVIRHSSFVIQYLPMRDNYLEEYFSFLRFPSVSTDSNYAGNVRECADWVAQKLSAIGLEANVVPTAGHPIVWARNEHRPGRRTVLIYGHYDV